jgi:dCMP deaminase
MYTRDILTLSNKWDIRYLDLAKEIASWSKDPSKQIGAVAIGEKGQVLAQGYNGFPRGIDDSEEKYLDKETKYKYVVHAEMNCIYNATYNGVSLQGATLYISGLPTCSECAKGLIQVGVKRVVYQADDIPNIWAESNERTIDMFSEADISYERIQ